MNIYVGNLPKSLDDADLADLFARYGTVDAVRIIKDRYSGESREFGFVEMADRAEAEAAVAAINGHQVEDKTLTVNEAKRPRRNGVQRSFMNIYVGNLPENVTNTDLEQLFAQYGQVDTARVISDRHTGEHRGFGFVEMANRDEAENAIEALDGHKLEGRTLRVNEARERRPRRNAGGGGFRGRGNM